MIDAVIRAGDVRESAREVKLMEKTMAAFSNGREDRHLLIFSPVYYFGIAKHEGLAI